MAIINLGGLITSMFLNLLVLPLLALSFGRSGPEQNNKPAQASNHSARQSHRTVWMSVLVSLLMDRPRSSVRPASVRQKRRFGQHRCRRRN